MIDPIPFIPQGEHLAVLRGAVAEDNVPELPLGPELVEGLVLRLLYRSGCNGLSWDCLGWVGRLIDLFHICAHIIIVSDGYGP